jgi:N6-L-threonylcarbamoyladenine synthase
MRILAFESSCDETSAALVEVVDGKFNIKSNIIASQIETHRLYGGVVPEIASRAHTEAISRITYEALDEAGVTLDEVDAVAVTANPGLIGALLVAVNFAKALAVANKKPLIAFQSFPFDRYHILFGKQLLHSEKAASRFPQPAPNVANHVLLC